MENLLQVGSLLLLITLGRLTSVAIGIIGLISLVFGRLALVRSSAPVGTRRRKVTIALVVGLTGMVLSALHLVLSNGGFGTGSGKLGAIVAMVVSLTGTALGALAHIRVKQITNGNSPTSTASLRK